MLLEVKNAAFYYPGPNQSTRYLFRDLNFSLKQGEVMTILGANGAGKTTMIRNLLGLLHWTEGETLLDHKPLKQWSRAKI